MITSRKTNTVHNLLRTCDKLEEQTQEKIIVNQLLNPKADHFFEVSFFVLVLELGSIRVSSDFAFLFRDLPAAFKSSASLFFSSSKSGFAVPSFSSLNLRTYSRIFIASSTLQISSEQCQRRLSAPT